MDAGAGAGAKPPVDVEGVLARCVALKDAGNALFKSAEENATGKAVAKWFEVIALLTTVSRENVPGMDGMEGMSAMLGGGSGPALSEEQAERVRELRVCALVNSAAALLKARAGPLWRAAAARWRLTRGPRAARAVAERGDTLQPRVGA
jgi:hypothetical protein